MLKYVLFSFFVGGHALAAAGSGGGIMNPGVNISSITSGVVFTITWSGAAVPVYDTTQRATLVSTGLNTATGFLATQTAINVGTGVNATGFLATQSAINTLGLSSATGFLATQSAINTLGLSSATGFLATQSAINTMGLSTATGFLAVISAIQAGTPSVSNTCWICNVTTSVTGSSFINTANAKKMIFQVTYALSTDHAAVAAPGVTLFVDGSMEDASTLPTTTTDPLWNTQIGTVIANSPTIQAISDPPNAVRFRLSGVFTATATVRYKLVY